MPGDAPMVPAGAPDSGLALLIGLAVGYGYYWFATRDGGQPEDEEEYDEEDEEDEVERPKRVSRLSRFRDVTTDSLIDRPAVLASTGKPGDCYKAVRMLPASQGLAQTKTEKGIFRRVLKAVADDCRGAEDAVDRAIDDLEAGREEIEDMLDVAPGPTNRLISEGLRRTKRKKIGKDDEIEALTQVAHRRGASARGGRPRGASLKVRRAAGQSYRLRKEKAPTKRGYKWRREEI